MDLQHTTLVGAVVADVVVHVVECPDHRVGTGGVELPARDGAGGKSQRAEAVAQFVARGAEGGRGVRLAPEAERGLGIVDDKLAHAGAAGGAEPARGSVGGERLWECDDDVPAEHVRQAAEA